MIIRWGLRLSAALAVCWMVTAGISLRSAVWDASTPIRFRGDISNGLNQGMSVLRDACETEHSSPRELGWWAFFDGFRNRYDVVALHSDNDQFSLDYTPARLLVMSLWTKHLMRTLPAVNGYRDEYAEPLLRFNTACELAAALFAFLLVRFWVRVEQSNNAFVSAGDISREWPWVAGLMAAAMLWFNPAVLADAHMWPQWDVWLLPWFVAAMWLASIDWWFAAGACVAIASTFKGQELLVAPALILWPLFGGRWGAAVRGVVGFAFAISCCASIWLLHNLDAIVWVACVFTCILAGVIVSRRNRWRRRRAWPAWGVLVLALIASHSLPTELFNRYTLLPILAVCVTPMFAGRISRRGVAIWIAAVVAGTILAAGDALNGSWTWLIVGYFFPTYHFSSMSHGCYNLAQLLDSRFGWRLSQSVLTTPAFWKFDAHVVTIKGLLVTIYFTTVVACAAGAANHARRKSARVLVSLSAPWILMFTILAQMHERYLLWGSAVGVIVIGSSLGMALLQLVIISLGTLTIYKTMLAMNPTFQPVLRSNISETQTGLAWMLMLAAAIYLYVAIAPAKRRLQLIR